MVSKVKDFIIANMDVFKTLSNEHRVNIIFALIEKDRLWQDLIYDYRINPKSLRDHTDHLIERGYIIKTRGRGFSITKKGRELCELKILINLKR